MKKTTNWTTQTLAEASGLTTARIRQLLIEGKELVGYKIGRDWIVNDTEAQRWLERIKQAQG